MMITISKYPIVMFMLVCFVSSCAKNDTDAIMNISHPENLYYYRLGEKRFLTKVDGKFYLLFNTKDESKLGAELAKVGIEFPEMKWIKTLSFYDMLYDLTGSGVKKFTNCTYMLSVKGDYEKAAAALSHSLYWAPYYKDEDGREVGTTELILVQLHPGTTLEQMKRLAKEYSVEMIGAAKYSPKFYLFACTNRSKGNALEMSAVFYESGLFEVVEPDEIITGHF